jgi:alanyl-tRNA synthetase
MPLLAKQFEHVFPELINQVDFVSKVVKEEEESFLRTLEKGLKRMDDIINTHKKGDAIEGKLAFELFDTYGFPVDLTRLIASENDLSVDEKGFEKEMQQQKDRSRAATAIDTGDWVMVGQDGETKFVGYTESEINTTVVKYRNVKAKGKEAYQWVLTSTPFYAESGGQIGDKGVFIFEDGTEIEIFDTKKENNLFIHFSETLPEKISEKVCVKINKNNRQETTIHHSATHLLHAALRNVLGTHVAQKGSLVNEEQLRFDFSHFAKMTEEELKRVEKIVNDKIKENVPVVINEMTKDEAIALGAMALFGEKYGDRVRVVIMDPKYSIELCGGTHVGTTGELAPFKLKSESSVAAGVRRIEAVAGNAAIQFDKEEKEKYSKQLQQIIEANQDIAKQLGSAHNNSFNATEASIDAIISQIEIETATQKELKKKLESKEALLVNDIANELENQVETLQNVSFLGKAVNVSNPDSLKKIAQLIQAKHANSLIVLTSAIAGKASVVVGVSESLVNEKGWQAPAIIKEKVAPFIKGGGGGQKTLASAGGQDATQLAEVIEAVKKMLN